MLSETKLKLLMLIVPKKDAEKLVKELNRLNFGYQTASLGIGTARTETLSILGIGEPERVVFYLVAEASAAYGALGAIAENFRFDKPGKGIGMILPLTGICSGKAFRLSLGNGMKDVPQKPFERIRARAKNRRMK